jgi:N-hydroxyarylamine O-acetyltransferase
MPGSFLASYFARIDLAVPGRADFATLCRLHAAHVSTIPFENLDILLGRQIRLDLESLGAKLIGRRRGGYCFEHNSLVLAVVRDLGFEAWPVEARVRVGSTAVRPRSHMALRVRADEAEWLVDAGFGGEGPLAPVSMTGAVSTQGGLDFRVRRDGPVWVLQARAATEWIDQYAFADADVPPIDFEVANWFTSTHPTSPFVRTLTAQRTTADARYVLRYPAYTESRGGRAATRDIGRAELGPLLRDVFLIDLPADTRFPIIDG